jgi:peptidoglycan-associated lipoprotein
MDPTRWLLVAVALGAACAKKATIETPTPTQSEETTTPVPAPAPPPVGVSPAPSDNNASRRTIETRIHFDYDRWDLTPTAQAILRDKVAVLTANRTLAVRIEGHADERGSDEYNLVLSNRRAAEAKRFLVGLGVDPSQLAILGLGEEQPLETAGQEAAWAANRRAEFRITAGPPGG